MYTLSKRLLIAVGLGLGLTVAMLWTLGAGQLPTAYATSYTVTRADDPAPGGCTPTDCSLREAVIAANTNPGPDTITLPADTYILSIAGTGEDAAQTGDLDITESVDINGAGRETTMIDANRIDRVFEVLTGSVTFSGVTIQRGYRSGSSGGGIRYEAGGGAALTIVNSRLYSNTSSHDGGGITMEEGANNASLSITNSIFISNTAEIEEGGAINLDSMTNTITIVGSDFIGNSADEEGGALHFAENFYTISIDDSLFQNNRTTDDDDNDGGGAINLEGITVTMDIVNSRFISNTSASEGGALRTDGDGGKVVTIRGSTFIGNTALDDEGGGALSIDDDSTTVEIYGSRFYSNTTAGGADGGAIAAYSDAANLQIHDSGFQGNISDDNGGAISFRSDGGILEVSNSSLSSNKAEDHGGGIYVSANVTATISGLGDLGAMEEDSSDVQILDTAVLRVQLDNVTIADNVANNDVGTTGDGGGIGVYPDLIGRVNIANSIIADNQDLPGTSPVEPDCSAAEGGIVSYGYNLIGDSSGCNWSAATDDQVGTAGSPVDPLLDPVVDTAATPAFYPLQVGSPAIDAGNPWPVSDVTFPPCRTRDQRGVARPQGVSCDIGAYEAEYFTLTVSTAGSGIGSVTGSGISCGTDCTESYVENTVATLTASADTRSIFTGWGGACTGSGGCVVTMTTAQDVAATFASLYSYLPIISRTSP